MINLQDLTSLYHDLFDISFIETFVLTGKIFGAICILLSIYSKIFGAIKGFDKMLVKNGDDEPIQYIIIRGVALLMLIGFCTQIFEFADNIFSIIEKNFISSFQESTYMTSIAENPYDKFEDPSLWNEPGEWLLSKIMGLVETISSGGALFGYATSVLLFIFDGLIYGLFLAERFFVLGIIKLFAPIIIALSIFTKWRNMIYDYAKTALRWYLVIIPFFFVNVFCYSIVQNIPDALSEFAGSESGGELVFLMSRTCLYVFLIILKFKLYNRSKKLMEQIIK